MYDILENEYGLFIGSCNGYLLSISCLQGVLLDTEITAVTQHGQIPAHRSSNSRIRGGGSENTETKPNIQTGKSVRATIVMQRIKIEVTDILWV